MSAAGYEAAVSFAIEQGQITRIYVIGNPAKLPWLKDEIKLQR